MIITIIVVVLVLFAIIFFHELGHFAAAKASGIQVLELGIGLPPRLFGKKIGETTYSLNLIPLGAFVQLLGEEDPSISGGLSSKSSGIRAAVGAAGPVANVILAFILFVVSLMIPAEVVVGGEGIKVIEIVAGSPAEEAGIQPKDVIISVEGEETQSFEQLQQAISSRDGEEVTIILQREGEEIKVNLVPRQDKIGVMLGWVTPHTDRQQYPFFEAIAHSGRFLLNFPIILKDSIPTLIQDPRNAVMGPVGIAQITGKVVEFGASAVVWLAGIVSIGVGIFNLLPFLPLDGGRIVVAVSEGARNGRHFSPQRLKLAYTIGWAVIIAIFILVTYNDILRLISGGSLVP
jgi:regulator of sigma E protease